MKSHLKYVWRICVAAAMFFLTCGNGWGAEPPAGDVLVESHPVSAEDAEDAVGPELPEDILPEKIPKETHLVGDASAGYRFFNIDGNGGRAAEYSYLHSNPELSGQLNYLGFNDKFTAEGNYQNDRDYFGDVTFDHKGIYRFKLQTESLFHNLDHEGLFTPGQFTTSSGVLYQSVDRSPGDVYGLRVEQDLASFRYKFPLYPLHLNLEYWRMVREGTIQQIFADHDFAGSPNTLYANSRKIDRETHEGNVVLDTHLGPVDLIYDFKIRQFGDHSDTPRDLFIPRDNPAFNGGEASHDETPDSRFYAHTVKLHTSLSGGGVGVASYTFAKRENLSGPRDFQGADQTSDTMQNVAGDFTYTPCGFFSMGLKYRRLEIDRDAPDSLTATNPAYSTSIFTVRPPIDTVKDTVTATLSFLPIRSLTIKGEYRGEFLTRDNLGGWNRPGTTASIILPDRVDLHRGTLTLLGKPVKGLRVKAQYSYSTADNAVYGNAFEQRHLGSLFVTYNAPGNWGATANARIIRESSDHLVISSINLVNPTLITTFQQPRARKFANATVSFWFVPYRNLTFSGSFGLLRNKTDQGVLFSGVQPASNSLADYTSQAQVYSLSADYRFTEQLGFSIVLQQVRSSSQFAPAFADTGLGSDIQRISQTVTRENSLSARGEYSLTKNLSCMLDYSYRDYDDKSQGFFSGTVHAVSAYVRAKW